MLIQKLTLLLPLRSVTTIHKDVTERLLKINPGLFREVREVLEENKSERHIRGGMATKLKYESSKKEAGQGITLHNLTKEAKTCIIKYN